MPGCQGVTSHRLPPWLYTRPVTSRDKLIVTSRQVSKKTDVLTQGLSLVSNSMQLIRGAQGCYYASISGDLQVGLTFEPPVYKQAAHATRNDVSPKPVASCGTKPTTGDKLWTKRSSLGNLGVACCMKLILRFSGTQAGRWVKWPRAI